MIDQPNSGMERRGSPMAMVFLILIFLVAAGGASLTYLELEGMKARIAGQSEEIDKLSKMLKEQAAAKTHAPDAAKTALYARVTEAAARAAEAKRSGTEAQFADAAGQYKVLFDGPASMEKETGAWEAMSLFDRALDAYAEAPALQKLSLDLAHICGSPTANEDVSKNAAPSGTDPVPGILADMTQTVYPAEAQFAAQKWLALVDAGQYAESWNQAAEYFKSAIPEERWERSLAIRKPYGVVVSRKPKGATYAKSLPGAPDGNYVVVQYDTDFASKPGSVETVTPMLEKDGKWRVSGYYIK